MSEGITEPPAPEAGGDSGYTPPATQQDLNRIITERVERERSKFADYKALQGKAAEFDKLAEANKSEVEKAQERVAAADRLVADIPAKVSEALKSHLVELHKISDEDSELFLTATDPTLLLKQVSRLTGRESERKRQGNHVPREGSNPPAPNDPARETVRGLFGG